MPTTTSHRQGASTIQAAAATAVLALAILASTAAVATPSGPAQGELEVQDGFVVTGRLSASGAGEIAARASDALQLAVQANAVTVERYWVERTVIPNPTGGGPIILDIGNAQRADDAYGAADLVLRAVRDDLRLLVMAPDEARVEITDASVAGWRLAAYKEPGLLLNEDGAAPRHYGDDNQIFTYVAAGNRFPVQAENMGATGDLDVYLWGADYEVEHADGTRTTYTTGARLETATPLVEHWILEYHLIRFEDAVLTMAGPAMAWFDAPRFVLDGSFTAPGATGWLELAGERYELAGVPLAGEGIVAMNASPRGTAQPDPFEGTHIGTSTPAEGVYPTTGITMDGELRVVSLAGHIVAADDLRAAAAAAAGITLLAAVLLALTQQGKWLLFSALAPLYAKTERHRLLEHPHRERLYEAIRASPGVNLTALARITDQGWGATVHHLKLLEQRGLVVSVRRGHERHFFVQDTTSEAARMRVAIAALATKETPQRVARAILQQPGRSQAEVAAAAALSTRVVSHHTRRLARLGLVEARRDAQHVRYWPSSDLKVALETVAPGRVDAAGPQLVEATASA